MDYTREPADSPRTDCVECGDRTEYYDEDGTGYCWDHGPIWNEPRKGTTEPSPGRRSETVLPQTQTPRDDGSPSCAWCGTPMSVARVGELCADCSHEVARSRCAPSWRLWPDGEWVCGRCHPPPPGWVPEEPVTWAPYPSASPSAPKKQSFLTHESWRI